MTHQPALFTEPTPAASGPVECLGLTFENDAARRAYFTEKLREKLQDPAFRQIEGFPLGSDEDILALSDPPYYTACPNPFLEDFVKYYGKPYDPTTDQYRREPFAADVSEGKNDPIYNAHSYHTKVPVGCGACDAAVRPRRLGARHAGAGCVDATSRLPGAGAQDLHGDAGRGRRRPGRGAAVSAPGRCRASVAPPPARGAVR